jgi:hypothetical protein
MHRLSSLALAASVFLVQVGTRLYHRFASSANLLEPKLPANRSSVLRCAPGSRTPLGGNPSSASSKFSSGIKNIWPSESFSCLRDNRDIGEPLFIGAGYADSVGMTIEACANFCDSQSVSYRFMGITDGFQCCMSTAKEITLTFLTYSACDNFFEYIFESEGYSCGTQTPCPGNPSEAGGCGGMEDWTPTASTYQKINSNFIVPALVPSVGLWNGLGCYKSVTVQLSSGLWQC